jgi:ribonuclease PH
VVPILDLHYDEDSDIGTDMNFVMNEKNDFIEIQGTAEEGTFSRQHLLDMMSLAEHGCQQLFLEQEKLISAFFPLKR